jgi:CDP-diacylglycerol--serine O-phosphatidyltransferase
MNEQPPKIYLLPNLMTAGNLFCGFAAAFEDSRGRFAAGFKPRRRQRSFSLAIWFILGAFVFDFLDGRLARWVDTTLHSDAIRFAC